MKTKIKLLYILIISNVLLIFVVRAYSQDISFELLRRTHQVLILSDKEILLVYSPDDSSICGNYQMLLFNRNRNLIESGNLLSTHIISDSGKFLIAATPWKYEYRAYHDKALNGNNKLGSYRILYKNINIIGVNRQRKYLIDSIEFRMNQKNVVLYLRMSNNEYYSFEDKSINTLDKELQKTEIKTIPLSNLLWCPDVRNGEFEIITYEELIENHTVFVPKNEKVVFDYFNSLINYLKSINEN